MICIDGKNIINYGDIIFDIGANNGDKTATYLDNGANVVCFEPQNECVIHLKERFSGNKHVHIVQKGLSAQEESLQLSVCASASTLSTFSERWKTGRFSDYTWDEKIEVGMTTLDKAIEQFGKPRYIKIDVEGYETNVIRGLTQLVDFLSFEFTSEFIDDAIKCVELLQSIGFNQFNFIHGEGDQLELEMWAEAQLFINLLIKMNGTFWGDIYATTNNVLLDTRNEQKKEYSQDSISEHRVLVNQRPHTPITFMIGVYNEESRIKLILDQATQWADDVLVINKSSTDRTKEICLQYGSKVSVVDIPFSNKGEGDHVSLTRLSKHDWIFVGTASEIPTFNVITKAKEVLAEREGVLDLIYVPRKIYSFGIHSELSPWSVSYYPFLYNRQRAIVSNVIHKNIAARDEAFTYRIPFSDDCCVYHFTHTTAKQYILDMLDYFHVEAANCTDPAAMLKECFENIATYKERLESGGFALLGHACAWPIYWLGTALFIWEKQRNIDVRQLYATMREDVFRSEWGSVCEQSVALTNVISSPVPLLWQPSWQVTSEDDLLHTLKEHKICCDIRTLFVVGAHRFQEKNLLFDMFPTLTKVYLFEPLPDFYNYLVEITKNDPRIEVFPYAISDQSGQADFYVTDNDAASSSLLHLGKHKEVFPHVNESACITVECRTIDQVISEHSLNPPDMLFIDVQGAEFKVLSSLSPFLRSTVKLIYTEASTDELYVNAHVLAEIQTLLKPEFIFLGFAPLYNETPMHGNALFINRLNVHGITLHKNLPPMSVRQSNTHVPLVSAIVSTYNSEKFIRGCLQDLVDQTLFAEDKLEVIVIDSCSSENEQNIVKEFQQKYPIQIKYLRTDERESIYKAWNRGAKLASGKYITNANTDDRHRLDALEIMSSELESSPGIALVYADQLYTNIPNETFASTRATKRRIWAEYSYPTLRSHCMVSSQPMWRRDLHERYGYFDESYVSAGDWNFWLRVGKYESFKKLNQVLGLYYENPDGIENSNPLSALESDRVKVLYGILPEEQRYSSFGYYNRDEVKVSVVIPCYNYAHYLGESVYSVINQMYKNFEIIIVNDGSTDNTEEIAAKLIDTFSDYQIRLITTPNSGHPGYSRNKGAQEAIGEYLLFLDADDKLMPSMLEECVRLLDGDPTVSIAYTDQIYFNDSEKRIVQVSEYDFSRLITNNQFGYCSLLRKQAWIDAGGIAVDIGYEDWDFWIRCGEKRHFGKRIPKALFCYRSHNYGRYHLDQQQDALNRAHIIIRHENLYETYLVEMAQSYLREKTLSLSGPTLMSDKTSSLADDMFSSSLNELFKNNSYETDKSCYLNYYDHFFANMRDRPVTLLELGVFNGGSLLLWRDYFPYGSILGLDINDVELQDYSGRIKTFRGEQQDTKLLDQIRYNYASEGFDIVIDDASHIGSLTKTSFICLFEKHLKPGGIYIIEDWGTGYWPDFPDGELYSPKQANNAGMVGFIKELIDACAFNDIMKAAPLEARPFSSSVGSVHTFPGAVVIVKNG